MFYTSARTPGQSSVRPSSAVALLNFRSPFPQTPSSPFLLPQQGFERSREPRAPTPVNPPSTRLFVANLGSASENQLIQVTCHVSRAKCTRHPPLISCLPYPAGPRLSQDRDQGAPPSCTPCPPRPLLSPHAFITRFLLAFGYLISRPPAACHRQRQGDAEEQGLRLPRVRHRSAFAAARSFPLPPHPPPWPPSSPTPAHSSHSSAVDEAKAAFAHLATVTMQGRCLESSRAPAAALLTRHDAGCPLLSSTSRSKGSIFMPFKSKPVTILKGRHQARGLLGAKAAGQRHVFVTCVQINIVVNRHADVHCVHETQFLYMYRHCH